MADRVIYMVPGETLEIRWMSSPDLPRNATEWRYQLRASRSLYRIWERRVAVADPSVQFDSSNEAWRMP